MSEHIPTVTKGQCDLEPEESSDGHSQSAAQILMNALFLKVDESKDINYLQRFNLPEREESNDENVYDFMNEKSSRKDESNVNQQNAKCNPNSSNRNGPSYFYPSDLEIQNRNSFGSNVSSFNSSNRDSSNSNFDQEIPNRSSMGSNMSLDHDAYKRSSIGSQADLLLFHDSKGVQPKLFQRQSFSFSGQQARKATPLPTSANQHHQPTTNTSPTPCTHSPTNPSQRSMSPQMANEKRMQDFPTYTPEVVKPSPGSNLRMPTPPKKTMPSIRVAPTSQSPRSTSNTKGTFSPPIPSKFYVYPHITSTSSPQNSRAPYMRPISSCTVSHPPNSIRQQQVYPTNTTLPVPVVHRSISAPSFGTLNLPSSSQVCLQRNQFQSPYKSVDLKQFYNK